MDKCSHLGDFVNRVHLVSDSYLKKKISDHYKELEVSASYINSRVRSYQGYASLAATGLSSDLAREISESLGMKVYTLKSIEGTNQKQIVSGLISDGSAKCYFFGLLDAQVILESSLLEDAA